MHVTLGQVVGTAVATAVVGFVVWLVTVPLRQRSVTGLIASVVLTGPLAVLGGIGWALILGPTVRGPRAALELALVAAVVAAAEAGVGAARAHRRFARAQRALCASLDAIAHGGTADDPARPLLSELEAVRRDLTGLAGSLALARARDHARDDARRRLIAWVSQDLHAPLTVLRAMGEPTEPTPVGTELDRLVSVVEDLADLAAAGSEPRALVVPRGHHTPLGDVLGDLVHTLSPLLRLREVAVHVRGTTSARVGLVGDDGEDLGRRLLTVLVEAVRASAPASTVTVEATCLPDDDVVRLDVVAGEAAAADVRLPLLAAGAA